ncbi:MAG: ATP-dependent DNA helicase RecG, partial [Lachnospiraceae bacterium]|nr:ATP-dependent DNA helicase RecG [Lachnospiraceae bacterium]
MDLEANVKSIKGIGDKSAGLLGKLGVYTVADLICHYPRDYEIFTEPVRIAQLKAGQICTVDL